jgi:hypothetical protein
MIMHISIYKDRAKQKHSLRTLAYVSIRQPAYVNIRHIYTSAYLIYVVIMQSKFLRPAETTRNNKQTPNEQLVCTSKQLKASYTSSLRPHTRVAYGLIRQKQQGMTVNHQQAAVLY